MRQAPPHNQETEPRMCGDYAVEAALSPDMRYNVLDLKPIGLVSIRVEKPV